MHASSKIDVQIWFHHFGAIYSRRVVFLLLFSSLVGVDSKPKIHPNKFFSLCRYYILAGSNLPRTDAIRRNTVCVYGYVCKRPFEHLSIILKYLLDFDWVLCWFNIDFNMLCLPFLISLFQSFCTLTSIYSIFIAFAIGSTTFSATLAWYWTLSQ